MKLVAMGGSLRANSYSAAALRAGTGIASSLGAATDMLDLRLLDLPMYIPDLPIHAYPKNFRASLNHFVQVLRSADVMIWATPTYHGAMSGVFKNAVDHMQMLSRDPVPYLQGKAVGLISVADASPLANMAACVHELRAWLAPTRLMLTSSDFSEQLELASEVGIRRVARVVDELLRFKQQ
jgi:FMN reductase